MSSSPVRLLLLTMMLLQICEAAAHRTDTAIARPPYLIRRLNTITLNFPNYTECQSYPGISLGIEYQRCFGRYRQFAGVLSFTSLLWAGTQERKEYYAQGHRANIKSSLIGLGANYYPFRGHNLEVGILCWTGEEQRVDSYRPGKSYGTVYGTTSRSTFFAPQFHFGISGLRRSGFILTVYADFGPILAASQQTRTGNYGTIGIKIGSRF